MKRKTLDKMPGSFRHAIETFKRHGGILRTAAAICGGIHPATLYALRDAGTIERLSRGLYRLANAPPLSNPDLVLVAARVPNAVLCLISALSFHELTTQVPHEVQIALGRGAESYCQMLCMGESGGASFDLQSILEFDPFQHLAQQLRGVQLAPALLRALA